MASESFTPLVEAVKEHGRTYGSGVGDLSTLSKLTLGELIDVLNGLDVRQMLRDALAAEAVAIDCDGDDDEYEIDTNWHDEMVIVSHQTPWQIEHITDPSGRQHEVHVLPDPARQAGGTNGSYLWASSRALVEWLCAEGSTRVESLVANHTVLVLGAGLGFEGLCLHALGARRVMLTDVAAQVPLLRRSIDGNQHQKGCSEAVSACSYVWGEDPPADITSCAWDLIVGCDLCYDEAVVASLASTIARLLVAQRAPAVSPKALLALPARTDFYDALLKKHQAAPTVVPLPVYEPDYQRLLVELPAAVCAADPTRAVCVERVTSVPSSAYPTSWPCGKVPDTIEIFCVSTTEACEARAIGRIGSGGGAAGCAGETKKSSLYPGKAVRRQG